MPARATEWENIVNDRVNNDVKNHVKKCVRMRNDVWWGTLTGRDVGRAMGVRPHGVPRAVRPVVGLRVRPNEMLPSADTSTKYASSDRPPSYVAWIQ